MIEEKIPYLKELGITALELMLGESSRRSQPEHDGKFPTAIRSPRES